eukprot:2690449-Rhodomonas_salina.3
MPRPETLAWGKRQLGLALKEAIQAVWVCTRVPWVSSTTEPGPISCEMLSVTSYSVTFWESSSENYKYM